MHDMGAPRISTTVKVNTRADRHQTLEGKGANGKGAPYRAPYCCAEAKG